MSLRPPFATGNIFDLPIYLTSGFSGRKRSQSYLQSEVCSWIGFPSVALGITGLVSLGAADCVQNQFDTGRDAELIKYMKQVVLDCVFA